MEGSPNEGVRGKEPSPTSQEESKSPVSGSLTHSFARHHLSDDPGSENSHSRSATPRPVTDRDIKMDPDAAADETPSASSDEDNEPDSESIDSQRMALIDRIMKSFCASLDSKLASAKVPRRSVEPDKKKLDASLPPARERLTEEEEAEEESEQDASLSVKKEDAETRVSETDAKLPSISKESHDQSSKPTKKTAKSGLKARLSFFSLSSKGMRKREEAPPALRPATSDHAASHHPPAPASYQLPRPAAPAAAPVPPPPPPALAPPPAIPPPSLAPPPCPIPPIQPSPSGITRPPGAPGPQVLHQDERRGPRRKLRGPPRFSVDELPASEAASEYQGGTISHWDTNLNDLDLSQLPPPTEAASVYGPATHEPAPESSSSGVALHSSSQFQFEPHAGAFVSSSASQAPPLAHTRYYFGSLPTDLTEVSASELTQTQASAVPHAGQGVKRSADEEAQVERSAIQAEETDGDGRRKKSRRGGPEAGASNPGAGKKFACPYFKRNPKKYQKWTSCPGPGWDEVHRVKTHLYRRHQLPIQCPRCWTVFQSDGDLQSHIQQDPPCPRSEKRMLQEGFTKDQEKKLRSRKKTHADMTDEDKWREIYMILFPDDDPTTIPSPYYSDPEDEASGFTGSGELEDYATFVRREMPTLVRRELEILFRDEFKDVEERLRPRIAQIVLDLQPRLLNLYKQSQLPLSEYGPGQFQSQTNEGDPGLTPVLSQSADSTSGSEFHTTPDLLSGVDTPHLATGIQVGGYGAGAASFSDPGACYFPVLNHVSTETSGVGTGLGLDWNFEFDQLLNPDIFMPPVQSFTAPSA